MFLVVCTHAYAQGVWQNSDCSWGRVFIPLTYWHVPAFITISGWFGITFRWKKFLGLWCLSAFYGLPAFLNGGLYMHRGWHFVPATGWFLSAYLMLMLIAPIINAGVEKLSERGRRVVLFAAGGIALALILQWFTPLHDVLGIYDTGAGTLWMLGTSLMTAVYTITRLVRTSGVFDGKWHIILGAVAAVLIGVTATKNALWWNFGSPAIWGMGIAFTGWFITTVKIKKTGGLWAFISPSMLGVYILHENTKVGPLVWSTVQRRLFAVGLHPFGCVMASAVVVFMLCLAIDLMRRAGLMLFRRVIKWIQTRNRFPTNSGI